MACETIDIAVLNLELGFLKVTRIKVYNFYYNQINLSLHTLKTKKFLCVSGLTSVFICWHCNCYI
jgi:hypothetical protein